MTNPIQYFDNFCLLKWVIFLFYKPSTIGYELFLPNKAILVSVFSPSSQGKLSKQSQILRYLPPKQGIAKKTNPFSFFVILVAFGVKKTKQSQTTCAETSYDNNHSTSSQQKTGLCMAKQTQT